MTGEGFAFHAWHRLTFPMAMREWLYGDVQQCRCTCLPRWIRGDR
jgi:hypothetical protein